MKKTKKEDKQHGVISVVQSPKAVKNKQQAVPKSPKTDNGEPTEHGIISVVQAPDEAQNLEKS